MGQDVEEGRLVGGRYRLEGVLGRGGMGTVWRGRDETLGRTVAVKELRFPSSVDEDEKQRLIIRTRREAKAIARIRSGSAVTVFDVVDEDDRPWIVMELIEGGSLADRIRRDGPLTARRTAEVGLAVLDVLRAAHREGILHRDVKPSNVLLEEGTERVVLTDFGIAKVEGDPSITSTGMLVGAPSYISPERARGKPPGPPADLWSLGGTLYAAVEGRPPYDKGSALLTLTAVMTEPLPAPEKAGELAEVLHGLLEKDPEKRLDVDGARDLLEAVASGAAAVPEVPDATRTVALPPAPEDTGSEGDSEGVDGAGEGGAGKDGAEAAATSPWSRAFTGGRTAARSTGGTRSSERMRDALKSVRNAAAAHAGTAAGSATAGSTGAGRNGAVAGKADDATAGKATDESTAQGAAAGTAGAAVKPAGEAGDATGAVATGAGGPAPAQQGGSRLEALKGAASRRVLVAVGALVAVLVVIGAVLFSGEEGGNGAGTADGGNSAGKAPGEDMGEDTGKSSGKNDGEADKGGGEPAPDPGASDGTGGDDGGDEKQDDGGLPEGYTTVEDSRFHFSVAMPEGFERYAISGTDSGGKYAAPDGGYPKLQVDFTSSPGDDAVASWESLEPATRSQSSGYKRISIEEVDWRGYPTVADWVFERTENGQRVRVLNRGFKVDENRGYAILVTCKADAWDGDACTTMRETAFRTFQPR